MIRNLLIILLTSIVINHADAQTLKAFLKAADEATLDKDYYNAMYYYATALEFDSTDIDLKYKFAESAKTFNSYRLAEKEFQFVTDNDTINAYPLAPFHLAEMQQQQGNYEAARRNYELFIAENSEGQERFLSRAYNNIEAIDWAIRQIDTPQEGVTITHLGAEVNTPYSEFAASEIDDELIYSSLRFEDNDDNNPNRLYSKIIDSSTDLTPATSDKKAKKKKNNVIQHEANSSYSVEDNVMYYTICNYENSMDITCEIYVKNIDDSGKGTKLPAHINALESTSTHPNIYIDPLTGDQILYFISDRQGGKGGLDIWFTEINDGTYSIPQNLESLNTNYDEATPYFHGPSGYLYFSSNGYMGLGGYDVYKSKLIDKNFAEPENLLTPTNTSFNDLYYTVNDEGTKAYLSSNRTGSLHLEDSFEACCYDIYQVDIEELFVDLKTLVFDGQTEEMLPGSRVRIIDVLTGEVLYDNLDELSNEHILKLKCAREYTIITDRAGYQSDTTSISLKDCEDKTEIVKKIFLTPNELKLDVTTFADDTKKALEGATVTLYDLTDPDLDPVVIKNLAANDFHFEVTAGREYQLVVARPGYISESMTFKALDVEGGKIKKEIYLKKDLFDLNMYLPVIVYFDNDRPNPRTRSLNTNKTYTDTYFPYLSKKSEFQMEFTRKMIGDTKYSAENDLEYFFETEVKTGYNKLNLFLDKLHLKLQDGDEIEVALKGYASPRAANKYNLALGQRRIWSVKNEFKSYDGGVLMSYINSGQLKVIEVSFGEEIAPKSISDSYNNKRLSIYSVDASRQRKAEVFRVKVIN